MATLVYKYGLRNPTENGDLVLEEIAMAHRYRNNLNEVERARRSAYKLIVAEAGGGDLFEIEERMQALRERVSQLSEEIRLVRQETRGRKESELQRASLRDAKTKLKEAREDRKRALAISRDLPQARRHLKALQGRVRATVKALRAQRGCHWGTGGLVEQDVEASAKKTPFWKLPRFIRFTGEGRVGVQIPGGSSVESVLSCTGTQIRISYDEGACWSPTRSERHRRARASTLRLRIGSNGRDPVWATFPLTMHRPLPAGSIIKLAVVHRQRIGTAWRWFLTMTVDAPPRRRDVPPGTVAVDIGWRKVDGGIRVATYRGDDGEGGTLVFPESLLSRIRKADELSAIRDRNLDAAKSELAEFMRTIDVPTWLADRTRGLHAWRSQSRLAKLVSFWKGNRFAGDEAIMGEVSRFEGSTRVHTGHGLIEWLYHDNHLLDWEANQRRKALAHRKEVYRVWASQMANRYGRLVLEKLDLRQFAERAELGFDKAENETARSNRFIVSISSLKDALVNAFAETVAVDPTNTTNICSECGHVNESVSAELIHHACENCGVVWDRDENAAINILRRYCESPCDAQILFTARDQKDVGEREGRFAKRKREKRERLTQDTSRNEEAVAAE